MTDTTTAPDSTPTTPAAAAAPVAAASPVVDHAARVADLEAKLAALAGERDTLAAAVAEKAKFAETAAGERDKALGEVQRLTAAAREAAVLDALFTALPHAPRTDVRRAMRALAGEGKLKLDTDTPDRAAADVLSILRAEGSALTRTPVGATGGTNPVVNVPPAIDPLLAVFGPRRK